MELFLSLIIALFASSILAAPSDGRLAARAQRRSTRTRPGVANIIHSADIIDGENITHIDYSSNWAGAVLTAPPPSATFNSVSGQFTVPKPSYPSSSDSGSYSAAIWVGIDGDTYQNSILQAGIDITVSGSPQNPTYSYDSWYEWFPDYSHDFSTSSFSFTAGDIISVSITSSSSTKGVVTLKNLTTKKSVSKSLTAPDSSAALGGQNAEWIVEDFEEGDSLVPFADFGTVSITNCVAGASDGSTSDVTSADIIEIEDDSGAVITAVTFPSSSEVQLVYQADQQA